MALGDQPAERDWEAWSRCSSALQADLDRIADQLCRRVLPLPSFAEIAETDLRPLVSDGLVSVLPAVIDRRPPSPRETAGYPEIIRALAGNGVSLDDILQGWHLTHYVLRRWARDQAGDLVIRGVLPEFDDLIYAWTDQGLSVLVDSYRELQARSGDDYEHRRAEFVRRLLLGEIPPAALEAKCRSYGLSLGARFHAFRAAAPTPAALGVVRSWLGLDAGPRGPAGAAALIGEEVWGITARLPARPIDLPVGVSGLVSVPDLAAAFGHATRALRTTVGLGLTGKQDVHSLGVRLAVMDDEHLGNALIERYVAPLQELGAPGEEILKTVWRFLSLQGHHERTAERLFVHANTVRHRIHRFEEITDTSMRSTSAMIEVWWALERQRMTARGSGSAPPAETW